MYYVSFGTGKKKLVVLPGLSDGLATVKGKALLLSPPYKKFFRDYTVYIFSRKNKMPEGYSIRDMAADQARAMKLLEIDQAYLLGVSQGGMIAQYIAIDHPEMVKKLILAVTAPNANDVARDAVTGWIGMAMRGDHTALMVDTAEKMYSEAYLRKNRRFFPLIARFPTFCLCVFKCFLHPLQQHFCRPGKHLVFFPNHHDSCFQRRIEGAETEIRGLGGVDDLI